MNPTDDLLPPLYRSEAFFEDLDPVAAPCVVHRREARRWPAQARAVGAGVLAAVRAGLPGRAHAADAMPHIGGALAR